MKSIKEDNLQRILLLNSAQGKYPRGNDPWVKATVNALENLRDKSVRLLASVGLNTWELTAYLGSKLGMDLELIVPDAEDEEGWGSFAKALKAFSLDRERTRPVFTGRASVRDFFTARDRLAFELANVVYPISVRPGGRLDALLKEFSNSGKEVCDQFRIKWSRVSWTPSYCFPMEKLNPELQLFERGWLTHWTHTWPGAWPAEEPWEFYQDMLADRGNYVRDAKQTLKRVIGEGLLRGSSWKMPRSESAISFTALSPVEAISLMRWRKRYTRYSLEPYGLAFRQESLERRGARPVRYLRLREPVPSGEERLFTQSAGRKGNWAVEREWRLKGDLRLEDFTTEELVLIAENSEVSEVFRRKLDPIWKVVPLFI